MNFEKDLEKKRKFTIRACSINHLFNGFWGMSAVCYTLYPKVGEVNWRFCLWARWGKDCDCLTAELDGLGFVVHLFDDGEGF